MPEDRTITLPWALAIALLLLLGLVLRLYAFEFPNSLIYDEGHFVENARNYLLHRADWNDHPPLGKLIIAGSIAIFGDRSLAWRLPSLVFGLLTLVAAGLTVARLFRSWEAGAVAAALLSADGFLIAFSRIGVLDGTLALTVVLALLLTTGQWTLRLSLAAGVLLGCAASIKFSGVFIGAPLLLAIALSEHSWPKKALLAVTMGAIAAGIYLGVYAVGLRVAGQPTGVAEVVRDSQRLLEHHARLTEGKNRYISSWQTWFLPTRPILMSKADGFGYSRVLTMLGNLATWWAAGLCAAALLCAGLLHLMKGKPRTTLFVSDHGRALLLLLSAAMAFLAPWTISNRDSYLYHYLPSYTALVLLLGGFVGWLRVRAPRVALAFLCVVLVVGAIYAPVWSSMRLSPEGVRARLYFEGWR